MVITDKETENTSETETKKNRKKKNTYWSCSFSWNRNHKFNYF